MRAGRGRLVPPTCGGRRRSTTTNAQAHLWLGEDRLINGAIPEALLVGDASASAKVRAALGDTHGAILALQKAVIARDEFFASESLAAQPFDGLRTSPGFSDVVRAAGLEERLLVGVRR